MIYINFKKFLLNKKTGVREQLFLILECVISDPGFLLIAMIFFQLVSESLPAHVLEALNEGHLKLNL